MKLDKVVITGFRSIKGTETISLDEKITVLIGANDHGKSNILDAVRCLNDDRPILSDDRNWDLPESESTKIEWHFKTDNINETEVLFKNFQTESNENIIKEGENYQDILELPIETQEELRRIVDLDTQSISTTEIDFLNARRSYLTKDQRDKFADFINDKKVDDKPKVEPLFIEHNDDNKIIYYRENFNTPLRVSSVPFKNVEVGFEKNILNLRPRVEFFEAPKSNLVDKVNSKQLQTADFEFMQGIFRLAGLWENIDTIFNDNDQTSKLLDEASKKLTGILNRQWNQGRDLVWMLKHTGTNGNHIEIRIKDPAVNSRYTRPSLRSSGFRTYFQTSMVISARTANNTNHSYIYLFDEPGIYLHPNAQLDLQRSYESIAENAQILYTTHSLFLINKNYPERNKVISKSSEGTKINQKPYLKNWKSVRESLGILMSNNFLIAEKSLIVEGASDIIYVLETIKKLKSTGDIDIDLNDLSIIDAGNSQNYVAMTKMMLSEGRKIVALLDGDNSGFQIASQLNKICVSEIKNKNLEIINLDKNKSIEDYFVDIKILQESIEIVANDLISLGVRKLKDSLVIKNEILKINDSKTLTLGKIINDITSVFYEPNEPISKLSIALKYEDIVQDKNINLKSQAIELIKRISLSLNLRGERSYDSGMFEESK
jgi:predicted ATP-dependent endonuclease of OLD family